MSPDDVQNCNSEDSHRQMMPRCKCKKINTGSIGGWKPGSEFPSSWLVSSDDVVLLQMSKSSWLSSDSSHWLHPDISSARDGTNMSLGGCLTSGTHNPDNFFIKSWAIFCGSWFTVVGAGIGEDEHDFGVDASIVKGISCSTAGCSSSKVWITSMPSRGASLISCGDRLKTLESICSSLNLKWVSGPGTSTIVWRTDPWIHKKETSDDDCTRRSYMVAAPNFNEAMYRTKIASNAFSSINIEYQYLSSTEETKTKLISIKITTF